MNDKTKQKRRVKGKALNSMSLIPKDGRQVTIYEQCIHSEPYPISVTYDSYAACFRDPKGQQVFLNKTDLWCIEPHNKVYNKKLKKSKLNSK